MSYEGINSSRADRVADQARRTGRPYSDDDLAPKQIAGPSRLEVELVSLSDAIGELELCTDNLYKRLAPVLVKSCSLTDATGPEEERPAGSELTERVRTLHAQARRIYHQLNTLRNRIEL